MSDSFNPQEPNLSYLDYQLPKALIASKPAQPRDHSRLLHLNKVSGEIKHYRFYDLPTLLKPGDILVRNNSKVIPARLFAHKNTGGRVEILLNRLINANENIWECLLKPGVKTPNRLLFDGDFSGDISKGLRDDFTFIIKFNLSIEQFYVRIEKSGHTPLPPYIPNTHNSPEEYWRAVYQTQFAKNTGSVAAPTAGLHFTPELDEKLRKMGVQIEEITLHVGLGTFAPLKKTHFEQGKLHTEDFSLSEKTAQRINQALIDGRRIIAVGTTTTRVLEYCAQEQISLNNDKLTKPIWQLQPQTGSTDIFIFPPYQYKIVSGLITNFHLPKTSLLLLVSAFVSQPNTPAPFTTFLESSVGKAYQEAIQEKYRFFSFGDAMFVG